MIPPKTAIYFTLNFARVLSLIALSLTFASTILVMVNDIQAVNQLAAANSSSNSDVSSDNSTFANPTMIACGYIAYVPT